MSINRTRHCPNTYGNLGPFATFFLSNDRIVRQRPLCGTDIYADICPLTVKNKFIFPSISPYSIVEKDFSNAKIRKSS